MIHCGQFVKCNNAEGCQGCEYEGEEDYRCAYYRGAKMTPPMPNKSEEIMSTDITQEIREALNKLEQARLLSVKEPMFLSDRIELNNLIRDARSILTGLTTKDPGLTRQLEELDAMQIAKNRDIHKGEDYNSEDYRIYNRGGRK